MIKETTKQRIYQAVIGKRSLLTEWEETVEPDHPICRELRKKIRDLEHRYKTSTGTAFPLEQLTDNNKQKGTNEGRKNARSVSESDKKRARRTKGFHRAHNAVGIRARR